MSLALPSPARIHRAAGLSLLEALLALLLLSVCLVPAAEALRGAIGAPGASAQAAIELDCVSARMEAVQGAAGNADDASVFSTAADGACPAIKVAIARYGIDRTRTLVPNGSSNYLLQVSAELADTGAGNRFTLNTLVTQ
jgi:hypothetical protein